MREFINLLASVASKNLFLELYRFQKRLVEVFKFWKRLFVTKNIIGLLNEAIWTICCCLSENRLWKHEFQQPLSRETVLKPQKTQLLVATRTLSKAQLLTPSIFNFRAVWTWGDIWLKILELRSSDMVSWISYIPYDPTTHILVLMLGRNSQFEINKYVILLFIN